MRTKTVKITDQYNFNLAATIICSARVDIAGYLSREKPERPLESSRINGSLKEA